MKRPLPAHRRSSSIFVLLLLALAVPVHAHDRGTSFSSWSIHGPEARVTARIAELEITRLPWATEPENVVDQLARRYFSDRLVLLADGERCPVIAPPRPLAASAGTRSYEWRIRCPSEHRLQIRSDLMLDVAPAHLHFARLERDGVSTERVLSERDNVWDLDDSGAGHASETQAATVSDYVRLGIEHILTGYDHLAFIAALLLLAGSLPEVARIVTGFTVAHSITLGLMALGYLHPERAPIEALIGLSIALVAAENSWELSAQRRGIPLLITATLVVLAGLAHRGWGSVPATTLGGLALFSGCYFALLQRLEWRSTLRWAIAFIFGLIHGFGFAGVLGEAGLSADRLLPALLGFNLGVEIGQLTVVGAAWPVLYWLRRRRPWIFALAVEGGSAAVFALGLYWFATRAYS